MLYPRTAPGLTACAYGAMGMVAVRLSAGESTALPLQYSPASVSTLISAAFSSKRPGHVIGAYW